MIKKIIFQNFKPNVLIVWIFCDASVKNQCLNLNLERLYSNIHIWSIVVHTKLCDKALLYILLHPEVVNFETQTEQHSYMKVMTTWKSCKSFCLYLFIYCHKPLNLTKSYQCWWSYDLYRGIQDLVWNSYSVRTFPIQIADHGFQVVLDLFEVLAFLKASTQKCHCLELMASTKISRICLSLISTVSLP